HSFLTLMFEAGVPLNSSLPNTCVSEPQTSLASPSGLAGTGGIGPFAASAALLSNSTSSCALAEPGDNRTNINAAAIGASPMSLRHNRVPLMSNPPGTCLPPCARRPSSVGPISRAGPEAPAQARELQLGAHRVEQARLPAATRPVRRTNAESSGGGPSPDAYFSCNANGLPQVRRRTHAQRL